jgi:hypothetical protein
VKGEINLTRAGLVNAAQHGITPGELWHVIDSHERVIHAVGEVSRLISGLTAAGRGLAILVQEAVLEDDVWDVVAARELTEHEATRLAEVIRRRRG